MRKYIKPLVIVCVLALLFVAVQQTQKLPIHPGVDMTFISADQNGGEFLLVNNTANHEFGYGCSGRYLEKQTFGIWHRIEYDQGPQLAVELFLKSGETLKLTPGWPTVKPGHYRYIIDINLYNAAGRNEALIHAAAEFDID